MGAQHNQMNHHSAAGAQTPTMRPAPIIDHSAWQYHITRWPACVLFQDAISISCIKRTQLGLLIRLRYIGFIILGILPSQGD